MKTYQKCPSAVLELAEAVLKKHLPDLHQAGLTYDLLFVDADGDGHPLMHGGYPAQAVVRRISLKDRAAGRADAEIVIDRVNYEALSARQREALLYHEFYHLELKFEGKTKIVQRDDLGHPLFKMRKHDWQFGWFDSAARIFGEDSFEVRQARLLLQEASQLYFEFAKTAEFA
jgi:Putative phage metallopeptidase